MDLGKQIFKNHDFRKKKKEGKLFKCPWLDEISIAKAYKIGNGNISSGIRTALGIADAILDQTIEYKINMPKRPMQIVLDEPSLVVAKKLGEGNVSKGIRIALYKTFELM